MPQVIKSYETYLRSGTLQNSKLNSTEENKSGFGNFYFHRPKRRQKLTAGCLCIRNVLTHCPRAFCTSFGRLDLDDLETVHSRSSSLF